MNSPDYLLLNIVDRLEEQQLKLCDIVWSIPPDHPHRDTLLDAVINLESTLNAIEKALFVEKKHND